MPTLTIDRPAEQCQNCGRLRTRRTAHRFTTFLGKPLCNQWRKCYARKLGYTAPKVERPPRFELLTFHPHGFTGRVRVHYVTLGGESRCVSV